MYLPPHFTESRPELLQQAMRENSFATIVTADDGVPYASHVPVLTDGDAAAGSLRIRGHFAHANPHWKQLADRSVLVIFNGPHGYVSPSWYEARPQNVPTWNYVAVHAYGRARLLDDAGARAVLADLVDVHERAMPEPWRMEAVPAALVDKLLGAIVGFEIAIDRLEGKLKLSQNRSTEDQRRVRERLNASDDATARDLARWMDPARSPSQRRPSQR
jgi:transcriptional regulator